MVLGPYPIPFSKRLGEDFSSYTFDSHGIPVLKGGRIQPVTVCQYGLFRFNEVLKGRDRKAFDSCADWLIQEASPGPGDSLVWKYQEDFPRYGLKAPWISGMAQGQAASLLLRAFEQREDPVLLRMAHSALTVLRIPVEQGGVLRRMEKGIWIEEYPNPQSLTGILNGCIFAAIGIREYCTVKRDAGMRRFFDSLMKSLAETLHRFDSGFWSYYELNSSMRLASPAYHRLHIALLSLLHGWTGADIFRRTSTRWSGYTRSPVNRLRWVAGKVREKWNESQRT